MLSCTLADVNLRETGQSMLKPKRIYDPPAPADGYRVLVDRLWPRGVSKTAAAIDLWVKEIAPSDKLRKWFGHEPSRWAEFQRKYHAELRAMPEVTQQLRQLIKEHRNVTLLYGARDEEHNQAVALRAFLSRRG